MHLIKSAEIVRLAAADYKSLAIINQAIELLEANGDKGLVTHHDLGLHNVLGIDSDIVVFDPDPTIDLSYIDLATSYIWAVIQSGESNAGAMLDAYTAELKPDQPKLDRDLFKYALKLRLLSKHARWLLKMDKSEISKMCVDKTRYLLD